jgi:Flp pilus assembly protein TadB
MLGVLGALGGAPPVPAWAAAAALASVAVGATAAAAALWTGQRGRRAVLARLTHQRGARALRVLAGGSEVDAFGLPEVEGWRGELIAGLARYTPARLRGAGAAAALARAGHFEPVALVYYAAARLAAPVLMPLLVVAATGSATPQALALGLLVGVVAPTAVLDRRAGKRRAALTLAIPDALDLLVVCLEAGVGVDAALVRVAGRWPPPTPCSARSSTT